LKRSLVVEKWFFYSFNQTILQDPSTETTDGLVTSGEGDLESRQRRSLVVN